MENNFEDKFINEDGSFDEAKFIAELEKETEMITQNNNELKKLSNSVKKINDGLDKIEINISDLSDNLIDEQILEERKIESELLDSMTQEERLEYIKNKNERVRAFAEKNNISIASLDVTSGDEDKN